MATQKQVNDFITKLAPIVIEICNRKTKKVLPSVCIAQACCESAYGTSPKMINANALFGIKVGSKKVHFGTAWKDKAYSTKTKECYDGKTYTEITDMFRAYDTIQETIEDYYDMLGNASRYAACIGVTDYVQCITVIKNGGYATSPTYIKTIVGIIKKYNLVQYDICMLSNIEPTKSIFIVGKTYKLLSNLYIRDSADGDKKPFSKITSNAKTNSYADAEGNAILKQGTVVTCKAVVNKNNATWIQIPSGWICGVFESGKVYLK